jgi:hypothetical protein
MIHNPVEVVHSFSRRTGNTLLGVPRSGKRESGAARVDITVGTFNLNDLFGRWNLYVEVPRRRALPSGEACWQSSRPARLEALRACVAGTLRRIRDSNPCYRRTPRASHTPVAGIRSLPVAS